MCASHLGFAVAASVRPFACRLCCSFGREISVFSSDLWDWSSRLRGLRRTRSWWCHGRGWWRCVRPRTEPGDPATSCFTSSSWWSMASR